MQVVLMKGGPASLLEGLREHRGGNRVGRNGGQGHRGQGHRVPGVRGEHRGLYGAARSDHVLIMWCRGDGGEYRRGSGEHSSGLGEHGSGRGEQGSVSREHGRGVGRRCCSEQDTLLRKQVYRTGGKRSDWERGKDGGIRDRRRGGREGGRHGHHRRD